MVEFACGIPSLIMGEVLPNIAGDVDAETVRHPVGVCVGITPYNFPSMVPLWMFPIAITCGNTFVLKPSEKVPLSAVRLGELLIEAGLPPGVFNIVHGDQRVRRRAARRIRRSPRSRSSARRAIAKYIYERGTANGKRVQSAGGAKNHLIIMPDADLDQTGEGARRLGLRLRRPALHGRQRRGGGRQGGRRRRRRARRRRRQACASARPTATKTSTWAR